MSTRFVTTTALLVLFSGPAFADCKDELDKLEPAVISAETGAATSETGTATKHQKEVMSGDQAAVGTETTGSTGEAVKAISPHQEEVTGMAGSKAKASQTMMEARKMANAGNENGCMQKVAELKKLVGTD